MSLNSQVVLAGGYDLVEKMHCPWQLAARNGRHWYVTGDTLSDFVPLCTSSRTNTPIFWSPDGLALYGSDEHVPLVRLVFDNAHRAPLREVVTPATWAGGYPPRAVWRAWWPEDQESLYCVVSRPRSFGTFELWRMNAKSIEAELLRPIRSPWHTELFTTENGPLVLEATDHLEFQSLTGEVPRRYALDHPPFSLCGMPLCKKSLVLSLVSPRGPLGQAGQPRVVAVDVETGKLETLADGTQAAWAPNGASLAVAQFDSVLRLVDWRTKRACRIAWVAEARSQDIRASYGLRPTWSPDGRWLLFTLASWHTGPPTLIDKLAMRAGRALPSRWQATPSALVADLQERTVACLDFYAHYFAWRPRQANGGRH